MTCICDVLYGKPILLVMNGDYMLYFNLLLLLSVMLLNVRSTCEMFSGCQS